MAGGVVVDGGPGIGMCGHGCAPFWKVIGAPVGVAVGGPVGCRGQPRRGRRKLEADFRLRAAASWIGPKMPPEPHGAAEASAGELEQERGSQPVEG